MDAMVGGPDWGWFPPGLNTGAKLLDHIAGPDASRAEQQARLEEIRTRLPAAPIRVHADLIKLGLWPDGIDWVGDYPEGHPIREGWEQD